MSAFDELGSIPPQLLAERYVGRVVHGEQLTLAVVEVAPGAVLPEHEHVHEQFGIVIVGSVDFRVGAETKTVETESIWRIPSGTSHTVTGGAEGAVVVDIFSPARDDWAARERMELRPAQWPQEAP
ncbi:MAG TPA: cupin domain-containing protein [Vicinamibacterales bacterium]|jgi:quercetin dioxygenase-like cupin family protein|nr:cupin domain-containing protein [Vicinamibacterales bacterium]